MNFQHAWASLTWKALPTSALCISKRSYWFDGTTWQILVRRLPIGWCVSFCEAQKRDRQLSL